ncbi:uncharacterized protein [Parasteatoda tepidariorum]|uniref:uncharacterized protein n=1 Tax=Parasteatoda tepidariorum TaxID=114398 RepID=UPI00077F970C|nr:uncharacterized protein LOC107441104 [Parasteatoda tepidariorum]
MSKLGNRVKNDSRSLKKYPLDTKEDPRKIFNFEYLTNVNTISHIKYHGRVMFIIRGIFSSKKTKLSDLLQETYPGSSYCSGVRLLEKFDLKDDPSVLDSKISKATIDECIKLVEEACRSSQPTIVVQNSHMRKIEMLVFLKLAIKYDYIVIVASTMHKFYITPEAVARRSHLNTTYIYIRLNQWEDVPPLFTAWFISANDSEFMRGITFEKLKVLNKIKLFRSWFETDDVASYFQPRANLCCLAGYSTDEDVMKNYYLSQDVQKVYGKCFPIFILGFLITKSDIIGVAQISTDAKSLVMDDLNKSSRIITSETPSDILHYGRTTQFPEKAKLPPKSSGFWMKGKKLSAEICRPIHIAQKGFDVFNMEKVIEQFKEGLQLMSDSDGSLNKRYFESKIYKLNDDLWFTNVMEMICFSTIFTGFYV